MSLIKSKEEIELIRESALLVSKTLGMLAKEIKPGINTLYLDSLAETFIRDHDAVPGFLGLYDFPNTLCALALILKLFMEFLIKRKSKKVIFCRLIVVF